MATIIKNEEYKYIFSPYLEPVARITPGNEVIVYTEDAFKSRIKTEADIPSKALATVRFLNPQTGPIYIEGAEPGDTLKVEIQDIELTRDYAVSCFLKHFGGLHLEERLEEKVWIWRLVENRQYLYNEEIRVKIPVRPFYGTFGVAPEIEAISTMSPGPFGGNMDVPDITAGNTVYLPVYNKGALFYMGDCHAAQGEGELCGVACEITAKATIKFDLIKGKKIAWPRIESKDKIMAVGSARPMEDAARIAYAELLAWLAEDYGFTKAEAYELLTQVGGLYVGNMVDTSYSLVASIHKRYLQRIDA
ncbi:Acetamidase/Formamidase [Moorella glycerini]|uniref:Acetamidase n=1 Tax=Neomoorella stamsii TaxID=1266720 RepID=A0A9X7J0K3_9FIRM|nr:MULTISPECIES: acetamidase/formamidase family protein [Moorella]PRR68867.1 Acetamidase [Moorella stamsii]CEP67488.1 Acetamidase/Formamidase [Moorella glycerini]